MAIVSIIDNDSIKASALKQAGQAVAWYTCRQLV